MKRELLPYVALAAIAAGAAWWFTRPGVAKSAAGAVVGAGVNAVAGGVEKIVEAPLVIGDALGLPRTSKSRCEQALADGRMWDASFDCPAGTFIGNVWERLWK